MSQRLPAEASLTNVPSQRSYPTHKKALIYAPLTLAIHPAYHNPCSGGIPCLRPIKGYITLYVAFAYLRMPTRLTIHP